MIRTIFALSLLICCAASLSAQSTNFPITMTTDWSIVFNGQVSPASNTSGTTSGTNFASCAISTDLSSAAASCVGTAPTAPAVAPGINVQSARQIQALRTFGTGTARVIASASSTAFRAQFGTGTGRARSRAAFTTSVPGGDVAATARIRFNMPTLLTLPQSVDVTETGTFFFQYETQQNANGSLSLNVGGGARFDTTAQVTAVAFLN